MSCDTMADSFPPVGSRWRAKRPAETRTVIDSTYGGDVVYVVGRVRGRSLWREWGLRASLNEWNAWAAKAVRFA